MDLIRPSAQSTLMGVAKLMADRSTCARARVGAVIANQGRILSSGYNGTPAGMSHCDHTCNCIANLHPSLTPEVHEQACPVVAPCRAAVHAEANAIAWAARTGVATLCAEMFVTLSPCVPCTQLIINAGITRVWYAEPYRDSGGFSMLTGAGVMITRFPQ